MKKTKLTELLSSFSNSEVKRFKNFLISPYFNNKPQFVKLFEAISKYHPDYENEKLSEESIFSAVMPGKQYSYTLFKNMLSDLYELAKLFLSCEEMLEHKLQSKNFFLNNIFRRRNIKELIAKEINIAEQLYEKESLNPDFFDNYYLFRKIVSVYSTENEIEKTEERSGDELESFFSMVLNSLLTYGLWFETYKVVSNTNEYMEIAEKLIDTFFSINFAKKPVNEIFYKTLQLLKTDDEKYYYEIINMLKDEKKFLNRESSLMVYQPLEAFLIKRIKNGEEKYYRPQFELYKHCLENGIYEVNDVFALTKLLLAVEPAIRIKEFEWAEMMINKYRNRGPSDLSEDYYNFNMSKVLQAKGENDKALDFLNKINPEISVLKSIVRNMQMKIYYELGYYELAKSQIDSYRHYISREQDFSEMYRESVYNFLKLYNKLIDLKLDNDKADKLDNFEYDIHKSKNIILRQWLTDKAAELKKGAN